MIGDKWENWASTPPPDGILIKAYGYWDPAGREVVGYAQEIKQSQVGQLWKTLMWRLTGIGKMQLKAKA